MSRTTFSMVCLLATMGTAPLAGGQTVTSPDGTLVATVSAPNGQLACTLVYRGATVLESSPLGATVNRVDQGRGVAIQGAFGYSKNETFPSRQGVHAVATNVYNGQRIRVKHLASGATYDLDLRVFNNGIAFRYEFSGASSKSVTSESTSFVIPANSTAWYIESLLYEVKYSSAAVESVPANSPLAPPLVFKLPSGAGYLAITQSALGIFGNPYLTKTSAPSHRQFRIAYPTNVNGSTGATASGALNTPWNVVTVGANLDALLNADIVESLAPAPDPDLFPEGTFPSWATGGRSVWDWLSRFPGGITAENAKLNNLWASKMGFEYNTIDEGWASWNGGNPWDQVRDVVQDANSRGVRILLWVTSKNLRTSSLRDAFFAHLEEAGVAGFKADFFDYDSQNPAAAERMLLMEDILKDAAARHLVANFHGCAKPVGQFRTYPNLLNCEAITGKEGFINYSESISAPLTRLLAGPADFTPLDLSGALNNSSTKAYEIATVINMAAPMLCLAERSDIIAESPFAPLIRNIPASWDESRVLDPSELGEIVAMARRKGASWFVGIMNGATSRSFDLPLSFLPGGQTFQAVIVRDSSAALEYRLVTSASSLPVSVIAGGGFDAQFTPVAPSTTSTLPFATTFSEGNGPGFFVEGGSVSRSPWAEPAALDPAPTWRWLLEGADANTLQVGQDTGIGYYGSGSLKISGSLTGATRLRLFTAALPVSATTKLRVVSRPGAVYSAPGMLVSIRFTDSPSTWHDFPIPAGEVSWNRNDFDLGPFAGKSIAEIALRFGSGLTASSYVMNVGEILVYDGTLAVPGAPTNVQVTSSTAIDLDTLGVELEWSAPAGPVRYYNIYQVFPDQSKLWLGISTGETFAVPSARRQGQESSLQFRVEAVGNNLERSLSEAVDAPLPVQPNMNHLLSGASIGTDGAWGGGNTNTRDKAFDGSISTYFDAPTGNGAWTGIDLGAGQQRTVTAIRYCPRSGWSQRMPGGRFQGANNADFSDAQTLATVITQPPEGFFTSVASQNSTRFRYLRYLSPDNGFCNVAEIQFYGVDIPEAPASVEAPAASERVLLNWQPVPDAAYYIVRRATSPGGPYVTVHDHVEATRVTDIVPDPNETYYYKVLAVNESGTGPGSTATKAEDFYVNWLASQGLTAGAAGTGFTEDFDHNGTTNGQEYAVPGGLRMTVDQIDANLRADPTLSFELMKSTDLLTWEPALLDGTTDSSGAPSGFKHSSWKHPVDKSQPRLFYRLEIHR